jgi:uncharacterized protein (TIGR03435 family)
MAGGVAILALRCGAASAQPTFDVASVKRIVGASGGIRQEITRTSLSMRGVTLGYCIRWAYGLRPYATYQTAGPSWVDPPYAEFYDVVAKTDVPATPEQLRMMLRTLLAARFKLVLHQEQRNTPIYALTTSKDGPKMVSSNKPEGEGEIKPRGVNVFDCEGCSMARLADFLDSITRLPNDPAPVVNETRLQGTFDFSLDLQKHKEYDASRAPVLDDRGHVDMRGVVMRTLPDIGLKLEAKRSPIEVLVIDQASREPTAN